MDLTPAIFGRIWSSVLSLARAEISTVVGRVNLFFAGLMATLTWVLADKILAQSTLNWAAQTGVGSVIFHPLMVGFVLTALVIVVSLILIYLETTGRNR